MHLHRLTLRAIGPFDGEHTIDFDRLGASGLFLLEGPTGAGKSTIIDAIVFALYGGLAGEESSKQRLHSHHAAVGVEPYVDLIFSTQAGDFRIRRSPAHQRPKNRGVGTTIQNESATLARLASLEVPDRGEPLSTRTQEIGNEIKEIVGLDRQQFLQTVVLPQGEFATFLRSTGEDRKDLLRTIFRTDVYEALTDELKSMRNQAGKSIDASRARVAEAFAGFAAASEHEFENEPDDGNVEGLREVCVGATASLTTDAQAAGDDNERAQIVLTLAQIHHQQQTHLDSQLRMRADLLQRQVRLAEQAEEVQTLRKRIDLAHRAAKVAMSISGLRKAKAQLASAGTHLESVQRELEDAKGLSRDDLVAQRDAVAAEIADLRHLLDLESRLPERRIGLADRRHKRDELAERINDLREAVAAAPELVEGAQDALADLRKTAQSLTEIQARSTQAVKALDAAKAVEETTSRLERATTLRVELSAQAREANDWARLLRQRRLDEYAGVLAQSLEVDEPCAVCGSAEHPAPAKLQADHPSDADIDAADKRLAEFTAALAAAAETVHTHKEDLARRQEQAHGLEPAQAKAALDEICGLEAVARHAHDEIPGAEAALEQLRARQLSDDRRLTQAEVDLAVLDADLIGLDEQIETDGARIASAIHERADTLSGLVATLRVRREQLDRVLSARDAHAAALEAVSGRQEELDLALDTHGFTSIEAAEHATLGEAELQTLSAQVRAFDRDSTLVDDRLADPEIAELTGDESTDVEAATVALDEAQRAAREIQKRADLLTARAASATKALAVLNSALGVHTAALTESGAIVRLAGVTEGSHPANTKKVSLGTYVLMRRFDDVVAAANARYGPMSGGRYQLVRIEENEGKGGGRRTGLALAVHDGDTGRQREPRTLSGGETFEASLCLALGLADVVTGEAGGIELGTLFVDEGFGMLDDESIDRVMVEIGKLSKGGRMVGIVSHVEELKQRLAERVEVRRKPNGASTLTVRAEGESLTGRSAG